MLHIDELNLFPHNAHARSHGNPAACVSTSTVVISAQGTSWAVAGTQAFCVLQKKRAKSLFGPCVTMNVTDANLSQKEYAPREARTPDLEVNSLTL